MANTYSTTYSQAVESEESLYDEIIVDRTVAGLIRTRVLIPTANIKLQLKVVHPVLTQTQKDDVITFYKNNRDLDFYFTWKANATQYLVRYTSVPNVTMLGGSFYKVDFTVAEV
jgi:hypothetical protein